MARHRRHRDTKFGVLARLKSIGVKTTCSPKPVSAKSVFAKSVFAKSVFAKSVFAKSVFRQVYLRRVYRRQVYADQEAEAERQADGLPADAG